MLTSETKNRINACRDILVGKLPLPTDQVELITLALIYKFMDDLDEESVSMGGKRSFFTGHLEPYRWRNLLPQTVSAEQRMSLFARGIELLGGADMEVEVKEKGETKKVRIIPAAHLPGLFRDVFRNAFLKFRDGRILTMFLTEVNAFAYSHSEELGNAFEYLLQCMGTQGENGQFRTPRHIIDFIVACLDPQPGERILDPACGTGGFLVSAYKHMLAKHTSAGSSIPGDRLTHAQRQQVYANLTGYDTTDLMVKLSKVNLFLHGFPDPAIHIYDTLSNDARWNEKADLILANPPFMTPKGGVVPHTKFRIPAKKAEVLFTDYIAEHLSSTGRGGVIVPNGIVATTQNAYVKLRRFLVEDSLVAVVSLPGGVFKPYSGVKTSILLLDKKLARQTKEILFLKITADGFDLGDKRNPIEANDLPEAERVVKLWFAGKLNEKIETPLTWKVAEKRELLGSRDVSLSSEKFLGEPVSNGGDVPIVELGEIVDELESGVSVNSENREAAEGEVGVLKTSCVTSGVFQPEQHKAVIPDEVSRVRCPVRRNTIIISRMNTEALVGANAYVAKDFPHLFLPDRLWQTAITRQDVEVRYVQAVLASKASRNQISAMCNGTSGSMKNISKPQLLSLPIPLPPLEEQRRIVAEIEGYQKVLDGARHILAGYRFQLDVSPDWESRQLGEICQFIDYRGKTPEKSTSGIPLITAKNIRFGFINLEPAEFVTEETYQAWMTRGFPKKGDVLFTTEAPMGMAALIDDDNRFALAQRSICLSPDPAILSGGYLCRALLCEQVQKSLEANATGSTVLGIKASSLKEIEIPIPPLAEQERIVSELDAEAAQMAAVRSLIPRFEAKIQRVLDRVWGTKVEEA